MSSSTAVLAWIGFACGALVIIGTSASIIGALVVPRRVDSIVSMLVEKALDKIFYVSLKPVSDYEFRERVLGWQAPLALVTRLTAWMALMVFGFGLMLLPANHGQFGESLRDAGSSIFTLGFAVPHGGDGQILTYLAGFVGMLVIGLQVGYLPTIYSEFNRRETEVSLLVSRAGLPAWGPEVLIRTHWGTDGGDVAPVLQELYVRWERWTAEVAESHTTYPTLLRLRSPRAYSHWLTSLVAIMDSAALHLALAPTTEPKITARLILRMGFETLNGIARVLKLDVPELHEVTTETPISIPYGEFVQAANTLRDVGYPVTESNEDAWTHFVGWRANYDAAALALCCKLDAPPAMWTGTRRWPSEPIPPRRPARGLTRN